MSIRWTEKQANGMTLVVPNPDHDNKSIGATKNYLRKHSRKFNAIFENAGL